MGGSSTNPTQSGIAPAQQGLPAIKLSNDEIHDAQLVLFELNTVNDLVNNHIPMPSGTSSFFSAPSVDLVAPLRQNLEVVKTTLTTQLPVYIRIQKETLKREQDIYREELEQAELAFLALSKNIPIDSEDNKKQVTEWTEDKAQKENRIAELKKLINDIDELSLSQETMQKEISAFLKDNRTALSTEGKILLGKLRHFASTQPQQTSQQQNQPLPKDIAAWSTMAITAFPAVVQTKDNRQIKALTGFLTTANSILSRVESAMRNVAAMQTSIIELTRTAHQEISSAAQRELEARRQNATLVVENKKLDDALERATNMSNNKLPAGAAASAMMPAPGQQNEKELAEDEVGILDFWSQERFFLIKILMAEFRKQTEKGNVKITLALKQVILNLATKAISVQQGFDDFCKIKVTVTSVKPALNGQPSNVKQELEVKHEYLPAINHISRTTASGVNYMSAQDPVCGKDVDEAVYQYEFNNRLAALTSGKAANSLLPKDHDFAKLCRDNSTALMDTQHKEWKKDVIQWNNAMVARKNLASKQGLAKIKTSRNPQVNSAASSSSSHAAKENHAPDVNSNNNGSSIATVLTLKNTKLNRRHSQSDLMHPGVVQQAQQDWAKQYKKKG